MFVIWLMMWFSLSEKKAAKLNVVMETTHCFDAEPVLSIIVMKICET